MDKSQRKMIILQGGKGVGKTTVLNRIIDELITLYGFTIKEDEPLGRDRRILLLTDSGVKIAICTSGDNLSIIEGNYRFFIEHNSDVMVSACNINPVTHIVKNISDHLTKTALIAFASGYWESKVVHFIEDSEHVKQFTLFSRGEGSAIMQRIIKEILYFDE